MNSNLVDLNGKLEWKSFAEDISASNGINISSLMTDASEMLVLVHCLVDGYYRRFSKVFIPGYDIVSNGAAQQYFPMGGYYSTENNYFCGISYNPATGIIKCDAFRYANKNYLDQANMWIFYR